METSEQSSEKSRGFHGFCFILSSTLSFFAKLTQIWVVLGRGIFERN